jgi:hypothetical protein
MGNSLRVAQHRKPRSARSILRTMQDALTSCAARLDLSRQPRRSLIEEICSGTKTCGWNYVEGLRSDDRPDLGIFWDKEGLGHNGERLSDGGHIVMFVSGFSKYIPAEEWGELLVTQSALRAARLNVTSE